MLYGYIRVSTIEQDTARQRADILEAANAAGLQVAKWVEEKVSGVAKDRAIRTLIDNLEEGEMVAVTELSRVGRSLREINDMVSKCRERHAAIWTVNNGQHLGADMDVAAEALLFALGIGAQIERDLIIERTRSGLRAARARGVRLGRIPGTSKLDDKADEIQKLIAARVSKAAVARILGVSRTTVVQWVRRHAA
jgi:DNA invertase Pin-like site-specific DNA recombinase